MDQHQMMILITVIAVVVVIAIIVVLLGRKRRSQQLKERFGPEYDRVVRKEGAVGKAESVLEIRAKRLEKFEIRPLSRAQRTDFGNGWMSVQTAFIDNPQGSLVEADQLITEIMQTRGYPMSNFEQRVADISVDHPVVVENYRTAHDIAVRHGRGQASTEDLRKAIVHYRSLFDELLEDSSPVRKEARG